MWAKSKELAKCSKIIVQLIKVKFMTKIPMKKSERALILEISRMNGYGYRELHRRVKCQREGKGVKHLVKVSFSKYSNDSCLYFNIFLNYRL